jgi:hypothetical protein
VDGLAFSTSLKGGYLNDGSDYDRNRIVHTFYASQPCPMFFEVLFCDLLLIQNSWHLMWSNAHL